MTEKLQLEEELQLVKGILTSGKNVNQCLYFSITIFALGEKDKDMLIAKLMKEKSQLKEELQKDITTNTKCIQCDYWTKTGITDLS